MTYWGRLGGARDLRCVVRLDDLRHNDHVQPHIEAVVLTTHDLNLKFVLTELLPGFLLEPNAVPPGLGPGHRTYRGPMLDLPACAIVFAPEASTSCDTPWRPPSLHVCPYRGPRRQHAKVTAVLYRTDAERYVRLIASSANLTRRGFAANLEVAAFEDYPITKRNWPSLHALRLLLAMLAEDSSLGETSAYRALVNILPETRGQKTKQDLQFVQSAEPELYSEQIAEWLGRRPESAGKYARSVLVSPFFSARGDTLKKYFDKKLALGDCNDEPFDVVVDGRDADRDRPRNAGEPFTTPPAWLEAFRAGSATYRPTFVATSRDGTVRGTGGVGRALHAKLLGVGYHRAKAKLPRLVWRVLAGSSNFTEAGFGLLGANSNIEAGFLVEHEEKRPGDLFGEQALAEGLCKAHALAPTDPDRKGPDLAESISATSRGKRLLAALDADAVTITTDLDGKYHIAVALPDDVEPPEQLRLGKDHVFDAKGGGMFVLTVDTLMPFCLSAVFGGLVVQWPLPTSMAIIESVLLSTAAARRRTDRLLDYWLRQAGTVVEPDDEELSSDSELGVGSAAPAEQESAGSWRLNRLLLGIRRRLAESINGTPPRLPHADALIGTVRARELFVMSSELDVADRAYFGSLVRAMFYGYAASELKSRKTQEHVAASSIILRWKAHQDAWIAFDDAVDDARRTLPEAALSALDVAADTFFESVLKGDVVQ